MRLTFRSIRARLQIWYAIVLLVVICGFAGVLYHQVRTDRLRQADSRLESGARYLEATLRSLPPHEFEEFGAPRIHPGGDLDGARRDAARGDLRGPPRGDQGPELVRPERPPPPLREGPPHDGPPHDGPPRARRRPGEQLRAMLELPGSILDVPSDDAEEWPYFVIWRANNSVLASSIDLADAPRPDPRAPRAGALAGFRWRPGDRREVVLAGPRGSLILVGKPLGRELRELRSFAWRIGGAGVLVFLIGLLGGWMISHGITRPIASISSTAASISATNLAQRIDSSMIEQELAGLADTLNQMFSRLEAAFVRQSRFTSDASHELRTPLAIIQSHVELALSKHRTGEEYRETLTACLKASSRMATLVDGLLILARADADRLGDRLKTIELPPIIEEVVDQHRRQAELAQIELSSSISKSIVVQGDSSFLSRIPLNLISNSMRYTQPGGRVHVELRADREHAILTVEDTGCGIAAEDQPKVFERFFRADKARSRAFGGNGLGLAICKSLVEMHDGSIQFTSAVNRGTRFEVRLPLAARSGSLDRMPVENPPTPSDFLN